MTVLVYTLPKAVDNNSNILNNVHILEAKLVLTNQQINILLPSVLWHCWLGIRKNIWSVKIEWCGAGMVVLGGV